MLKTLRILRTIQNNVLTSSKYEHPHISRLHFLLSQQYKRWEKRQGHKHLSSVGMFIESKRRKVKIQSINQRISVWNGRKQKQKKFKRFPFFLPPLLKYLKVKYPTSAAILWCYSSNSDIVWIIPKYFHFELITIVPNCDFFFLSEVNSLFLSISDISWNH